MKNQELQNLKNKFDIIGNDPALNRALEIAVAVAPTDITVLVSGESGVGKENIPRTRKGLVHRSCRDAQRLFRGGERRYDFSG